MKSSFSAVICSVFFISLAVAAQEMKLQEPEYLNVFYYLQPESKSLITLERRYPDLAFQTRMLGFGGAKSVYRIEGMKSPIRFKQGSAIGFVVRGVASGVDPNEVVKLIRLDVKKRARELLVWRVGAMATGATTVNPSDRAIEIRGVKYGEYSLMIEPVDELKAGEYALTTDGLGRVYCFGIDEK